ncbi:MAG: hypothetical protein ACI4Q3_02075 [Kiritimatiellia bacterium]
MRFSVGTASSPGGGFTVDVTTSVRPAGTVTVPEKPPSISASDASVTDPSPYAATTGAAVPADWFATSPHFCAR